MNRKSIDELRKLNTKNLLRYFKAERNRFYGRGYWCGCGCYMKIWDAYPNSSNAVALEQNYKDDCNYLDLIKTELNKREHINKN